MGRWVRAATGQSLCGIAVQHGFVDCQVLRNEGNNAGLRNRQVEVGDRVWVPDRRPQQVGRAAGARHRFVRAAVPMAEVRFVHGSADRTAADDDTLAHLNVSNYRTDRAGNSGTDAFPRSASSCFNAHAHADPDTFKLEVFDRGNRLAATELDLTLEALHPVYVELGAGEFVAINHDENWSSAAERARRTLAVTVRRRAAVAGERFRSCYLRLVTDEADHAARSDQTLLVTDDQPNEERVEILDQVVRATYLIQSCPIAGAAQCRATATAPIGARNRRMKVCVGIFRRNVGDPTGYFGCTVANVRHRVFKWFRRVYAQANLAPKLVGPGVRYLDPPQRNMLTISNLHGNAARGGSRMSFRITSNRPDGTVVRKDVVLQIPRAASVAARQAPIALANQLVAQINDADFRATPHQNAPSLGRRPTRRSADIVIQDQRGGRVALSRVRENDARASLRMATVRLDRVRQAGNGDMEYGSMDHRQIMRNFDSGPDRLDCYVVGRFNGGGSLRGRAFSPCYDLRAAYQPGAPAAFSCFMAERSTSGRVMDGGDNLPYTFPHEAGHSVLDCFHATRRTELMAGGGTSRRSSVRGTKRISDAPVRIVYANYRSNRTSTGNFWYFPATRLNQFADNQMASLFDAW